MAENRTADFRQLCQQLAQQRHKPSPATGAQVRLSFCYSLCFVSFSWWLSPFLHIQQHMKGDKRKTEKQGSSFESVYAIYTDVWCMCDVCFITMVPHCALQKQIVVHNAVQENVQFNAAASDISKEVYQASKRLQQLTQRTFLPCCCRMMCNVYVGARENGWKCLNCGWLCVIE